MILRDIQDDPNVRGKARGAVQLKAAHFKDAPIERRIQGHPVGSLTTMVRKPPAQRRADISTDENLPSRALQESTHKFCSGGFSVRSRHGDSGNPKGTPCPFQFADHGDSSIAGRGQHLRFQRHPGTDHHQIGSDEILQTMFAQPHAHPFGL